MGSCTLVSIGTVAVGALASVETVAVGVLCKTFLVGVGKISVGLNISGVNSNWRETPRPIMSGMLAYPVKKAKIAMMDAIRPIAAIVCSRIKVQFL